MADVDQERAFARLTEVGERLDTGHPAQAAAAARELCEIFDERPVDDALVGYATMVLDAALWLLAHGRDADTVPLCDAVVTRLEHGADSARAAAAGARFLAAQALSRLGEADESRLMIEALCALGEPALAALSRLTGRLTALGADPAWHAQVAATSATVLWRLGRQAEARTLAAQAADAFARLQRPDLEAMLRALGVELTRG